MLAASAKKIEEISQSTDPKKGIIKAIGDISGAEVSADLVLVGTYIRPEKTVGGIIRPLDNLREDEWQSKVGLVLKAGPLAYGEWESDETKGTNAKPGTWVVYAIKDGWPVQINGTPCRFVPYDKIRMRIPSPELVF